MLLSRLNLVGRAFVIVRNHGVAHAVVVCENNFRFLGFYLAGRILLRHSLASRRNASRSTPVNPGGSNRCR